MLIWGAVFWVQVSVTSGQSLFSYFKRAECKQHWTTGTLKSISGVVFNSISYDSFLLLFCNA